jgi:outer membrane receptor protein involved in Fe transport
LEVKEAFAEVRIPLLRDVPFFHELTLEASGRVSNYNLGTTGTVFAYNVSGIWAPVRDLRFRAGYAKSVRAPTISDLFNVSSQTFFTVVDPCSQTNINDNPNRAKNCAAAGVPTTMVNPANGQVIPFVNTASSTALAANRGNPLLKEEVGKSITVGFVAQPRFLPGFSLSVDYYDITVRDAIFTLAATTVINQCYNDPGGIDNVFCAIVNRRTSGPFVGTFTGQVSQVIAGVSYEIPGERTPTTFGQPFNYAKLETAGIDVEAAYRTRILDDAVLNLKGLVSWVKKKNTFSAVSDPTFANTTLREVGDPEWEANFKANLNLGRFSVGYDLRWIDKATIGNYEDQFSFQGRPPENADLTEEVFYPDVFYHDIRFEFKPAERFKFYVGVDNVTDRLPPLDLTGTGGQSGIYNVLGRFFYAGAEVKF